MSFVVSFVLYCVLKLLTLSSTCINHYAGAGRTVFLCWLISVCLFICLGNDANLTMCALDTRNDSKRDTNAVITVLLQFNSFFGLFRHVLSLVLHSVFVVFFSTDGWSWPQYKTYELNP